MINVSVIIACSVAEIEAADAGFEAILPGHFWIGFCQACDLDFAKFLHGARGPELP